MQYECRLPPILDGDQFVVVQPKPMSARQSLCGLRPQMCPFAHRRAPASASCSQKRSKSWRLNRAAPVAQVLLSCERDPPNQQRGA
jgi:hypothetical protein